MKKLLTLLITFLLMSCSNDDALSDLDKIETYKASLKTLFTPDNLIVSTSTSENYITVAFEDGGDVAMESELVSIAEGYWNLEFVFFDNSILNIGFVSDDLPLDYENDNSLTPLSKNFQIDLPFDGVITWKTEGRNGASSDISSREIQATAGINSFTIHGLYIDGFTEVLINYKNSKNNVRYSKNFTLTSNDFLSSIDPINISTTFNLNSDNQRFILFAHRSGSGPLVIDQFGDIRYYLNITPTVLDRPFYGLKQTSNGSLIWANINKINEYGLNGSLITDHNIPDKYGVIHHDIVKYDEGIYLLTVNNNELTTIEDIIILYDANTGTTIKEWDLNISVPKTDFFIGNDGFTDTWNDWFHVNAIEYVDSDQTLLISGQRSGVVKVSWDNELIWFLTDDKRFTNEPESMQDKILFNQFNEVITWGQHNIRYDEINEDYYLFDNGLGRNYEHVELFSRGVKFKVDENNFTYEILDSYGEEFPEYHSPIISGIDFSQEGNTLNLFGSIGYELTYTNNKDWLGRIWKDPQPNYGAVIQEYDANGDLILEFQISSFVTDTNHRFYNRDPGIYRASYFNFDIL
tara:strand:+ start:130 stop:1860 length:1731 start_codon:yes stop_codon:yes gene_type:complete